MRYTTIGNLVILSQICHYLYFRLSSQGCGGIGKFGRHKRYCRPRCDFTRLNNSRYASIRL